MGLDRFWRARLIKAVHQELRNGGTVLDVGTGTADLVIGLSKRSQNKRIRAIGLDHSYPMLSEARTKLQNKNSWLLQGSARNIPLADGSCDAVMNAFVLRNIKRIMGDALSEIHRVLKPDGKIFFLEMYVPENFILRSLHRVYLKTVLPLIGKLLFGKSGSQVYLANTIFGFGAPFEFSERLVEAGFRDVQLRSFSGGIAVLHSAVKKL